MDCLYVMETETKAYCEPKIDVSLLYDELLAKVLAASHTQHKWAEIFNDLEQGVQPTLVTHSPKMETVKEVEEESEGKMDIKLTPKFPDQTGIFSVFPTLSYDDDAEDLSPEISKITKEDVLLSIREFKKRFARLKMKWSSAFQDVEVSHMLVTADLAKVAKVQDTLALAIGTPSAIEGTTYNSVWQAITHMSNRLHEGFTTVQETLQLASMDHDRLSSAQSTINSQYQHMLSSIQDTLKRHETRFSKILPILMNVQMGGMTTGQQTSIDRSLEHRVHELSQAIEELKDKQWQSTLTGSTPLQPAPSLSILDEKIRDMEAQIQTMQMRIVGNGVQIGGVVFQCFEDVKVWVSAKFPIKRYGLFVDGVSLLDFFTFVSHVDTEKSMSAFYNQQKSGFASMYEARLASSTQNLFPMVFGRSNSAGMDDSEYLPALQDPDKWDNGITGLRYQISRGMGDVEFQLESTIESILKNYPEPHQIAKECLYKSKRFVMDLCAFISQDFQKWQHRGHSKKESWRMTTVCVHRIFEEIHSQRVVARDILDVQDGDFSCAKFLWATWKAHETMGAYVRHQFYEHPSIAAVLARHLADNHVKPDEAVSSKVSSLEKAIKNINGRLDSHQTALDKCDDKFKEVKEKVDKVKESVANASEHSKFPKKSKGKDKHNNGGSTTP